MAFPILPEEERSPDALVLGTGLTECLIAASLARHGKKVLHLDRDRSYGGNWRSLNLKDFELWASAGDSASTECEDEGASQVVPDRDVSDLTVVDLDPQVPASCFVCRSLTWDPFEQQSAEELEVLQADLRRKSNSFNVDVVPRTVYGRSDFVDVLVESGVSRYLEFQGLKSAKVLTKTGLVSVPMTRSEIFQDTLLTPIEKRLLMRFITSMSPIVGSLAFQSPAQLGTDQAGKVSGPSDPALSSIEGVDPNEPWTQFLEKQKLTPRLQEFLTYAICLWDWALPGSQPSGSEPTNVHRGPVLTTEEGLRCLSRLISSLGLHGGTSGMPLLYPLYGVAEVAQGFTRMCALHKGIYVMELSASKLLAEKKEDSETWSVAGIVTQRGEVIRSKVVIASRDHLAQKRRLGVEQPPDSASGVAATCARMVVLLDCPLLEQDGLNFCVVPPSLLDPPLGNVVQVLQLDSATGTCPRGYSVAYLSQARNPEVDEDPFADLGRVLNCLLELCGGPKHCLFRGSYIHRSRLTGWDLSAPGGEVLAACTENRSVTICGDPSVVPQLLSMHEVPEALDAFVRCPLHSAPPAPESFLRKPEHVAQEERDFGIEDLEALTEGALQAAVAPIPEQSVAEVGAPEADGAFAPDEASEVRPTLEGQSANLVEGAPDAHISEVVKEVLEVDVSEVSKAEGAA